MEYFFIQQPPPEKKAIKHVPMRTLLWAAIKGLVRSIFETIEHILIWFAIYPTLVFASLYLAKLFLVGSLENAGMLIWLNLIINGSAFCYFLVKLKNRYIESSHKRYLYTRARLLIWSEVLAYSAINTFSYLSLNLELNRKLITSKEMIYSFAAFYGIYVLVMMAIKLYYRGKMKHHF
ncbi:MAG: hypothetical protein PWR01_3125 [Clostridiales bacterium]|jgi:hypothetical protein|nr:hypothetical protein [Clostridiales bacterium]MDN5282052.1 hypothetical protein [Candidatus Ozemobacter sp.]